MSGDEPAPVRVGVLIVRAWFEPSDGGLVIRIVSRDDVTADAVECCATTAVPEAVERVERWLRRFTAGR